MLLRLHERNPGNEQNSRRGNDALGLQGFAGGDSRRITWERRLLRSCGHEEYAYEGDEGARRVVNAIRDHLYRMMGRLIYGVRKARAAETNFRISQPGFGSCSRCSDGAFLPLQLLSRLDWLGVKEFPVILTVPSLIDDCTH
jgi:hypothetical protein